MDESDPTLSGVVLAGGRSTHLGCDAALDPVAKVPEYKVCAVRVKPA